jgi:hypothetical protein
MQEDVLVMDVGCACDVLWMYVMDYVCVLCDAKCLCAVSCIIYEFCVFALKESNKQKKANFPALPSANTGQRRLCRVPGVWHSAKLEKMLQNSHFPSFAECHSLALGKEVNFAECQVVPLSKDYF